MHIYTVYLHKQMGDKRAYYAYIGWATSPELALANFSEHFGMGLAVHAKVAAGVTSNNEVLRPFWSSTFFKTMLTIRNAPRNYWFGSIVQQIDPNSTFENYDEEEDNELFTLWEAEDTTVADTPPDQSSYLESLQNYHKGRH